MMCVRDVPLHLLAQRGGGRRVEPFLRDDQHNLPAVGQQVDAPIDKQEIEIALVGVAAILDFEDISVGLLRILEVLPCDVRRVPEDDVVSPLLPARVSEERAVLNFRFAYRVDGLVELDRVDALVAVPLEGRYEVSRSGGRLETAGRGRGVREERRHRLLHVGGGREELPASLFHRLLVYRSRHPVTFLIDICSTICASLPETVSGLIV